ncbi:MAG: hypothetical protein ACI9T9_003053 [Oleiphilaceae bacterium]|jgi:hypothetical protein
MSQKISFKQDQALSDAVGVNNGAWGTQANENKPTLHTHRRHGARID